MICDGVNDLFNALIKIFLEKDETKQVYLIALFEGVCTPKSLSHSGLSLD